MVYHYALGKESGSRSINLCRKKELSSFYKPHRGYLDLFPDSSRWDIVSTDEIKLSTPDDFRSEVAEVDFIKLDTQGSEREILEGALKR